ncbi:MAG: OmpA family protein [Flavobacteriaceae bacterium]|nr:PD40 domain-containing protein [Bacteroidia bacterium]MBT8288519.1 PD40 domain-containing protein [Bacteroidia bacterium]NNF73854.1 OmpA family protein [Flavobacteriaceae bacterium]NNK72358.1 OmpA family protein [Flavobacteriaceae bacterium]
MKTKIFLILLAFSYSSLTFSQSRVADIFFENFAYIEAAKFYKMAHEKNTRSYHLFTRLGDCYYNNSNTEEALKWYQLGWESYQDDFSAEYVYKYIQCLRSQKDYETANSLVPRYLELRKAETSAEAQAFYADNLSVYQDSSEIDGRPIVLENLDLNTEYSDFGSFVHDGTLYFASSRNVEGKVYKWNELPYLDVYQARIMENGRTTTYEGIDMVASDSINTDIHEATVAITKDGNTMYFTRDNVNKRNKVRYNTKGASNLKIYKATNINGRWSNLKELPFNDNKISTGHPALSPDEKRLYFVSDRKEDDNGVKNKGITDIFYVDILDDGTFGPVTWLPGNVNSAEREMFPYVTSDNMLYYSSDSAELLNYGLLDIYVTDVLNDPAAKSENLKAPINGTDDDFAFYINDDKNKGYFSSNRARPIENDAKGNDDIYSFGSGLCLQSISGIVTDSETGELLENARVRKIDERGVVLDSVITGTDARYTFELECNRKYRIVADRTCYNNEDIEEFTTSSVHEEALEVNLELDPLYDEKTIVINDITFVFDRWEITADGKRQLENIITLMQDDPRLVIDIESHTDCRGSDQYNAVLSDKRAASTKAYFVGRGYGNRINSAVGKGESELLNKDCSDCRLQDRSLTAEQVLCHKENRRSVFRIVDETPRRKCE